MPVRKSLSPADAPKSALLRTGATPQGAASGVASLEGESTDYLQRTLGNQAIARMAGAAPPPDTIQRSAHDHSCGCPSCTSMQNILSRSLLTTSDMPVQRAAAHAHGCSCAACTSAGSVLRRLPAQRAATLQRAPQTQHAATHAHVAMRVAQRPLATVRPILAGGRVIQRHASWEHRALGDIRPDQLAKIGAWQNVIQDLDRASEADDEGASLLEHEEVDVEGVLFERSEILHVLQQEINRLKVWQDPAHTPRSAAPGVADKLKTDINDPEWQLHLVEIPNPQHPENPLVVTYGELNTLADFYGSVDELIHSQPAARAKIVQSVRAQSFEQLLKIYMQLNNSKDEKTAKKELGVEELGFAGSFNITDAISGEVAQMMVDKKGQVVNKEGMLFDDKEKTFSYTATLGRNACHFAPESWHAWATLHREARASAIEAYTKRQQAGDLEWDHVFEEMPEDVEKQIARLRAESQAAANMAMLRNGFGDHYLQDSYAAGHLINKTQVMQWFVQYLDAHPEKWTYSIDTSWRQIQGMAYNQPGIADQDQYDMQNVGERQVTGTTGGQETVSSARNPQTVENSQNQANIGWEQRFEMLGLKLPRSIAADTPALKLLLYLQEHSNMATTWTWKELKAKLDAPSTSIFSRALSVFTSPQLDLPDVLTLGTAVKSLVDDNIIYMSSGNRQTMAKSQSGDTTGMFDNASKFELRKEYIPSVIGGGNFKLAAADAKQGNMARFNKMAKATVYKDYVKFMRDSFLQKSTNALHDHYCLKGLPVYTGANEEIGHVYGDMHMLDINSAHGVEHSATTANMSRDSIVQIIQGGAEQGSHTTDRILARLPQKVYVTEGGAPVGLDEWHNNPALLKKTTEDEVFPTLVSVKEFGVGLSSGSGLGKITKDEDVHSGEAF